MYCSNSGSSMATLLQQKNCMKTLTNGAGAGSSSQAGRVLLPHEMVTIPTGQLPVSNTHSSSSSSSASSSNIVNIVHSTLPQTIIQQQQQQQQFQHPYQYNNYLYYNSIHSNSSGSIGGSTLYRQSTIANASIPATHNQTNVGSTISSAIPSALSTTTSTLSLVSQTSSTVGRSVMANSNVIQTKSEEINGIDQINTNTTETITNVTATEQQQQQQTEMDEDQEPEPEIDIVINNVVCSFSVRCHLNLREIALNGINVEFRRENGMVTMKLRRPYTTASIWSSGRITCTGATSEHQAKIAARRYARCLQKLGFSVKFKNFRVVNVLGTCSMPWAIKIVNFSERFKKEASYEPELHPGVTYKLKHPKATLKIFSTGSITVTASSVANVQAAIEHIFPLVYEFRTKRFVSEDKDRTMMTNSKTASMATTTTTTTTESVTGKTATTTNTIKRKYPFGHSSNDSIEDNMFVSDTEDFEDEVEDDI